MIHPEGHVFVLLSSIITILLFQINNNLGWLSLLTTILCVYFFRNPERITPLIDDAIISPADGIVQSIVEEVPPSELGLGEIRMTRISIFLNVLNVHVNRIPIDGEVKLLKYNPGKFLTANLDKASYDNERQSVVIETINGTKIVLVQIAGLVARRIVCNLEEGQRVHAGARYGIIRFGSRVDIYVPVMTNILVAQGQTCVGGETVLADLKSRPVLHSHFELR